jgi:hypothetical protein
MVNLSGIVIEVLGVGRVQIIGGRSVLMQGVVEDGDVEVK